jgi:hypothetical protein
MKLSPVQQKFILPWGEMGTRWGINRTVAQIHALLYVAPNPMHAKEVAETLNVARSNAWPKPARTKAPTNTPRSACASRTAFFGTTTARYIQMAKTPVGALVRFLNAGDQVLKSLGLGS